MKKVMILVASVALLVACGNASKKAASTDATVETTTETTGGHSCSDPACKEGAEAPECVNDCDSCANKGTENCKDADKCKCETKNADCTCDKADCKCKEEAK